MNITIEQTCTLWDKLRDALEGKASYGFEFEIYVPLLSTETKINEQHLETIESFIEVMSLFVEKYPDATICVNGEDYKLWPANTHIKPLYRVGVTPLII